MSAFEPQTPAEPKVDMPDFMVVLRGYDRRQVEMWAAEVASQIEQERLRADEAEKRAYRVQIEQKGAPSFSHLGSHVASILEEAGRSSENMLADAVERAQETIDAAEREAAEANRDAALRLARQAGHAELAAWTFEALAWWALADGRYRDAVELARAGQDRAPPASTAAIQLALDEAQAWASLGDQREASAARHQAALSQAMLPGSGLTGGSGGARVAGAAQARGGLR